MKFARFSRPFVGGVLVSVLALGCSSAKSDAADSGDGGAGVAPSSSSLPRACDAMSRDTAALVLGEAVKDKPTLDSADKDSSMCSYYAAADMNKYVALLIMKKRDLGCNQTGAKPIEGLGVCTDTPCACFFSTSPAGPTIVDLEANAGSWSVSLNGPKLDEEKLKAGMRAIVAKISK